MYVEFNSTSIFDLSLQQAISQIKVNNNNNGNDDDDNNNNITQYFAKQYNSKLANFLNTPYDCVTNVSLLKKQQALAAENAAAIN
eukprot:UN04828